MRYRKSYGRGRKSSYRGRGRSRGRGRGRGKQLRTYRMSRGGIRL